jgi:hypothetical protein
MVGEFVIVIQSASLVFNNKTYADIEMAWQRTPSFMAVSELVPVNQFCLTFNCSGNKSKAFELQYADV